MESYPGIGWGVVGWIEMVASLDVVSWDMVEMAGSVWVACVWAKEVCGMMVGWVDWAWTGWGLVSIAPDSSRALMAAWISSGVILFGRAGLFQIDVLQWYLDSSMVT